MAVLDPMPHNAAAHLVELGDLLVVPRGPRLSPHAWTALLRRLPPAEQHRIQKLCRWQDRQDSAIGWSWLLRMAGQHRVSVRRGAHGGPVADPPVAVSLSHGGGWIAVATHLRGRVGVDVEAARQVAPELARRCCSTAELAWLERAADAQTRDARFLWLWTAKEAYLKAIGTGLGVDPRSVCIDWATPDLRLSGAETDRWRFSSSTPADGVRVTVCTERAP